MGKEAGPDLRRFVGKRVSIKLNANRHVEGRLTGFDVFMNLTIEEASETTSPTSKTEIGIIVIRGNSVIELECLDR